MRKTLYKHAWGEVKQLWKLVYHPLAFFKVLLCGIVLFLFWLLILVRPKWYLHYMLFLHDLSTQEVLK